MDQKEKGNSMGDPEKKSWYELPKNKLFVMRTSREGPRSFLYNLWAPKVFFGKAATGFLSIFLLEQFQDEDRKVLIIVDANLEKMAIRVEKSLKSRGFICKIWNGVQPEVPIETIYDAVKVCTEFQPKILLAVGGGSSMDTAKLIFLFYEKPEIDFYNLIPINALGLRKKIKYLVAIPTTSGTGSEATFGAMVKDTTQSPPKKINIASMELLPDLVVLSYEYVKNLPPKLTAGTGVDALVHAISAYLSPCHNTMGDILSKESIRLIMEYLQRAYKRGNDMEAREKMQVAAFMGGLAISNVGVTLEHSLGHSLGNIIPVHHGVAVGIFAPYAIQFLSKNSDRYRAFGDLFGIDQSLDNQDFLKELVMKYKKFLHTLDLPTSIQELKDPIISRDDYMSNIKDLVQFAWDDICTFASLRVPTEDDLKNLFIYAYDGKDIDF